MTKQKDESAEKPRLVGMSLRDWFAGQALAASDWTSGGGEITASKYSAACYEFADAMLAEREKVKP